VILDELDVPDPLPPTGIGSSIRARVPRGGRGAKLIQDAKSPILLVGHGVHTSRTGASVKESPI